MRAHFTAAIGLALLATACGSTTTSTTSATTGGLVGVTSGGGMPSGAPCTYNGACASGICDLNGTGNCCLMQCTTGDPTCGATMCDSTGTCVYPQPSVSCGGSCANSTATANNCDGSGSCEVGSPMVCPNNLGCNQNGGCNSSCAASSDCASGFVCNGGSCGAPIQTGACTENDACKSNLCGVKGSGNCCAQICSTSDATCGATGCTFDAGACIFPDKTTSCGTAESCASGTQTNATACDGQGNCPAATTTPCQPFVCGATACLTACTGPADCTTGDFCDTSHSKCCGGLTDQGTMAVDGMTGSNSACCGIGGKNPCQTLTQAMELIDEAQAQSVTINATLGGAGVGGNWPSTETYPIVLGWGVDLKAPGIFFSDPNGKHSSVFDIKAYSANDSLKSANIVGTPGNLVRIGFNSGNGQSTDPASIEVESGAMLNLALAQVNGSATAKTTAILVQGGGTLILGQDQSGDATGTVTVGNSLGLSASDGYDGIVCGSSNGTGCNVSDVGTGGSSLVVEGQDDHAIDAEDYAVISLIANPVVGVPPMMAGFNNCTVKLDASIHNDEAILLHGLVTMTFSGGTVQCVAGDGFALTASSAGVPTLAVKKTTIQNTENGIHAYAGTATISSSTIQFNHNGVEQDTDGKNIGIIDLSGGKTGGTNNVACASNQESVLASPLNGVDVLNTTTASLNASNVDWDTSGPDLFDCDVTLTSCSCVSSSCTTSPGTDGMDAVYESTGTITTTGNGTSTIDCQPLCGTASDNVTCNTGWVCCYPTYESSYPCCAPSTSDCNSGEYCGSSSDD